MPNRLTLVESGYYYTADRIQSITAFAPAHCVHYLSQNSLPLTVFSIFTTRFDAQKNISVSKYCQRTPFFDYDSIL